MGSERSWCAECEDDDCRSNNSVVIKECNNKKKDQKWYFDNQGRVFSYVNQDYCFTMVDMNDIFSEFQFHPKKDKNKCLTASHHPSPYEKLRFTSCNEAYGNDSGVYDDTSHWVIGDFHGH